MTDDQNEADQMSADRYYDVGMKTGFWIGWLAGFIAGLGLMLATWRLVA